MDLDGDIVRAMAQGKDLDEIMDMVDLHPENLNRVMGDSW